MSEAFQKLLEEREQRARVNASRMRLVWIAAALVAVAAVAFLVWRGDPSKRPLNPNTATREQLATLPEIGPEIAQRIVQNRPYANAEELQKKVKGIGPKTLEKIKPRLDFDGDGGADCCAVP